MNRIIEHVSQQGLDLIKKFEGFYPNTYICPAGYPTIGYGHLIKKGETFNFPISKEEAEELLKQDAQVAEKAVLRLITVPLTQGQFDALVSFTFNLGAGALQCSTLRQKVNRGQHHEVPVEFMRWVLAGGKKLNGLIKRRECEIIIYI